MHVRLTQIDGKLPNLALMKLAHWHRACGDDVYFTKKVERGMFEPNYDIVYGSAIFSHSGGRVESLLREFPDAIVGGTWRLDVITTVEQHLGLETYEQYDYSIYPHFDASLGFTQRGCRLKCGFCVVPKKEGKPRSVNTIADIYRGVWFNPTLRRDEPAPRHLHLLDNDFFGQPEEHWRARLDEIRDGKFKVCFNQGINVRMITDESAAALKSIAYYDDSFRVRRLYTAWDNLKDEGVFMRGVNRLRDAGIPPSHLLVYMLVGWDQKETWERIFYRFNRMTALGIKPFPMIYGSRTRRLPLGGYNGRVGQRTLGDFQRWAVRKLYTVLPFEAYDPSASELLDTQQLQPQLI